MLPQFARTLVSEAPLLLLLAAVGVMARARQLAPWIALTMAAVILERQLAGYQYLLIIPGLAMAGGLGVVEISRRRNWLLAAAALAFGGRERQAMVARLRRHTRLSARHIFTPRASGDWPAICAITPQPATEF